MHTKIRFQGPFTTMPLVYFPVAFASIYLQIFLFPMIIINAWLYLKEIMTKNKLNNNESSPYRVLVAIWVVGSHPFTITGCVSELEPNSGHSMHDWGS